jgi:hypothetical protein
MWWATAIMLAVAAVVSAAALYPWAHQFRPDGPASTSGAITLRAMARSRPWVGVSVVLTGAVDVVALTIAGANVVEANRMSWGLAANWAFSIAVAAVVVACLIRGWRAFRRPDWQVFRWSFAVTLAVLWCTFTVRVALEPPGRAGDPSGIVYGMFLATAFIPLWVPFIGLPVGVIASYLVTAFLRRRRPVRI